jgi:CheY-like chemotaxis protein
VQTPRGGAEFILVVEGDALVREHLVPQLRGLGYRVASAADGMQALKLL